MRRARRKALITGGRAFKLIQVACRPNTVRAICTYRAAHRPGIGLRSAIARLARDIRVMERENRAKWAAERARSHEATLDRIAEQCGMTRQELYESAWEGYEEDK